MYIFHSAFYLQCFTTAGYCRRPPPLEQPLFTNRFHVGKAHRRQAIDEQDAVVFHESGRIIWPQVALVGIRLSDSLTQFSGGQKNVVALRTGLIKDSQ
jgi:hypothetical protein